MQFNSTSVSGIDSSEFSLQLPIKYILDVLDSHEVQIVREAYAYLHPTKSTIFLDENNRIISTCKKYHHIQFSGMKLSSQGKVPYALAIPVMQSDLNDPRPL